MARAVVVALPLLGVLAPGLARAARDERPAIERVDAIRSRLLKLDELAGNHSAIQQAQWFNFPNWPNWGNWRNWNNWPNWLNWGNW